MKYINTTKFQNLKINKENTYIVMDFDKTLTSKDSPDSWKASANFEILGEQCAYDWKQLNLIYEPVEQDYTLDLKTKNKLLTQWYEKSIELLYKYNLTYTKLLKSLKKEKIKFRNGAKEFLKKAYNLDLPIFIVSAGIGNAIEEFLKSENSYFSNIFIISNFLEFDKNGNAKPFNKGKIIHTLNKSLNAKLPKEQANKITNRKYKILIGDLKEDENMINPKEWDTTLKIGILNNDSQELLKIYNTAFDIVLTNEDADFYKIEEVLSPYF